MWVTTKLQAGTILKPFLPGIFERGFHQARPDALAFHPLAVLLYA